MKYVLACCALAFIVCVRQNEPGRVTAREIVLVDGDGQPRGRLGVAEAGYPFLEFHGPEGETALLLRTNGSSGLLVARGRFSDSVVIGGSSGAGLSLVSHEQERASLKLYEGNWPEMRFCDADGKVRIALEVMDEEREDMGSAQLTIGSPGELGTIIQNPCIQLGVDRKRNASLRCVASDGRILCGLEMSPEGKPRMSMGTALVEELKRASDN